MSHQNLRVAIFLSSTIVLSFGDNLVVGLLHGYSLVKPHQYSWLWPLPQSNVDVYQAFIIIDNIPKYWCLLGTSDIYHLYYL